MRCLAILLASAALLTGCSSASTSGSPEPSVSAAVSASSTAAGGPSAGSIDTSTWVPFAPAGEGFSVWLPGTPLEATQSFKTATGDIPARLWMYTDSSGRQFAVIHLTFPAGSLAGTSPGGVYDSVIGALATQLDATIQDESDVTIDGHAGRACTLGGPTTYFNGEFVLAGSDLYVVYFAGASLSDDGGRAQALFVSFHLTA
jgi:hypothetical protein